MPIRILCQKFLATQQFNSCRRTLAISHEAQRVNPKHILIMQPSKFILKGPLQIVLTESVVGSICLGGCIQVLALLVHRLLFSRAQLCLTLFSSMDCSPPGISVHGNFAGKNTGVLPFPPLGDLPDPGIKPSSLASSALAGGFFSSTTTWRVSDHLLNADASFYDAYYLKNGPFRKLLL